MIKATLCIPTVDRLAFFREALVSAALQLFDDCEILVSVNSPDPNYYRRVQRVVEEVSERPNARAIRLVKPTSFLHSADHANFLVQHANGRYWCYLADDDRLEPNFLSILVPLLEAHDNAGFAFCDTRIIDVNGTVRMDLSAKAAGATHRSSLREGFVPHTALARLALWNAIWLNCSLIRRAVLDQFPFESGNEAADRDFWLRIADATVDFGAVYTKARLLNYRVHENQYSKGSSSSPTDLIHSLNGCSRLAIAEPRLHAEELAHAYARLGKALLDEGKRVEAWRALLVALRKNVFDWRTYRFVLQAMLPASTLRYLRRLREQKKKSTRHRGNTIEPA